MAEVTFELKDGITVGDTVNTTCTIREPNVGDIRKANTLAEQLRMAPVGVDANGMASLEPVLVTSQFLVGWHLLRLQIVNIGNLSAPIEPEIMDKLSESDLLLIQGNAEDLDKASVSAVTQRGRDDSAESSAD